MQMFFVSWSGNTNVWQRIKLLKPWGCCEVILGLYGRQLKSLGRKKYDPSQIKAMIICFHLVLPNWWKLLEKRTGLVPQLNFYSYYIYVTLGNTWGMWFALQIQVHDCFLIARNNTYCHKICYIDNSWKYKRKYFVSQSLFLCYWAQCSVMPACTSGGQHQSLVNTRQLHFYRTSSPPSCYPLSTYLCQERWVQIVFQIGYICSCSLKRWHRLHSHGKSKSLPLQLTFEFFIHSRWQEINS